MNTLYVLYISMSSLGLNKLDVIVLSIFFFLFCIALYETFIVSSLNWIWSKEA